MNDRNSSIDDRRITNTAAVIMTFLAVGCLSFVWISFYNNYAFRSHRYSGAIVTILVYTIIYIKAARVYKAFKIASFQIGETAFSQCIAIGLADLIVYIECCLISRRYVNVIPGLVTVIIQFVLAFIWATMAKQYFLAHVQPQNSVLIYGNNYQEDAERDDFINKIESRYGHLFKITKCIPTERISEGINSELEGFQILFLYGVDSEVQSELLDYCNFFDKKAYITPTIQSIIERGFQVKNLIDTPLFVYEKSSQQKKIYETVKRILDIVFSLFFLVILSPIMLVTALLIRLEDHGDIFFKQKRVTKDCKEFEIIKFRSMIMNAETNGESRPCIDGDPRITRVGKIIRSTRIDELPQLINILRGDMSIVGPRPERVEHNAMYTAEMPEFKYRLQVKAGLTGYAQIYGKYNTSPRDKLLLDLLYIENKSFLLDLRILFLTAKIMFIPESTEGFKNEKAERINSNITEIKASKTDVDKIGEKKLAL